MPLSYLNKYWKYESFRPFQEEIINSIRGGNDTFVVLPTGGGKSVCYQVPALMAKGTCLVVSPLIALMFDQVNKLKSMGISAVYLHSALSKKELTVEMHNIRNGKYKLAYVSPERLESPLFQSFLPTMPVSFLAVDEAHCISQWGYDFRPSYANIKSIREVRPEVKIIALTASATPDVQGDIVEQLELQAPEIFVSSFFRPNLSLKILYAENKRDQLLQACQRISQSGIVYGNSRARVEELSQWLSQEGVSCQYYHAGLDNEQRKERQEAWLTNEFKVVIATNAFGMGIDKSDVQMVAHYNPPTSLESYYQEAGRAGRNGQPSQCLMMYDDLDLKQANLNLALQYPPLKVVQKCYEGLCNYFQLALHAGYGTGFPFDMYDFCQKFDFQPLEAHHCLHQLELLGYISSTDGLGQPSKVKFEIQGEALYDFQLKNESLEPLIKVLLRSYGGIHERYITFAEKEVAKRLRTSTDHVVRMLHELNKRRVISYAPPAVDPVMTFLTARVQKVSDPDGRLTLVTKMAKERWQAMHDYILSETCRMRELCLYFGENLSEDCGKCDVCRMRTRNSFSQKHFQDIASMIENKLSAGPIGVKEVVHSELDFGSEDISNVLRWLMDDGRVKIGANRNLYWNK